MTQQIERTTINRIADTMTARSHDKNAELSKSHDFFAWLFDFCKGNEELEQQITDELDENTETIRKLVVSLGVEIVE